MSGVFTAPGTNTTIFDLGLGRRKKSVENQDVEAYILGTLGTESNIFNVASVAISQVNTTISQYFVLPGRVKIPKIAVFFSAIGAAALGSASFNIVLGTAAYVQGSIPGNDNASVPPVSYSAAGVPTGTNPLYPAGGGGIASNVAVAGNAMFAADVVLNVANFPSATSATGTGPTYAQLLTPSNPDAVWPNGGVLTLRFTTPAGAGTITNFIISCYDEPLPLAPTYPSSQQPPGYVPVPGIDF